MKSILFISVVAIELLSLDANAQGRFYRSGGGEVILSGADVNFNDVEVETNMRFTLFFHVQQHLNVDLTEFLGLYTGIAIRNVGLITEDLYQNVGFSNIDDQHPNWNKSTKIKRRSYSLGFPLAVKLGAIKKHYFIYAGGEYEWMFHYKQKLFIDDNKTKFKEWASDRVNPWIPSVFAGVQFPGGLNLKLKYYLDDFLNTDFMGQDFGQDVDYSQFQSTGIWYISMAIVINKQQLKKMLESQNFEKSAYRY
ncbi:MAG: hypothetical protein KAT15_27040 [Bacteroidales bacterium]|nr:hypothetical protein [Bacteroidales bacterium]